MLTILTITTIISAMTIIATIFTIINKAKLFTKTTDRGECQSPGRLQCVERSSTELLRTGSLPGVQA